MRIDWVAVATVAAPVIAIFVASWWERRGTRLIAYYSHVATIGGAFPDGSRLDVNTHSVVLRSTGRRPATNVRLHHVTLPLFNIWPNIVHNVPPLPNGQPGTDIVIPNLLPGEQITIAYLYFPPMTFNQINQGIRCDQGFARPINVLLRRQFPPWLNRIARFFLLVGVGTVAWFLYRIVLWVVARWPVS
jgi:hypothetical protein